MFDYNESAKLYLNSVKASGCSADTLANYERVLRLYAEHFADIGKKVGITSANIAEYKVSLSEKGLKQSTIRQYMEALSLFFAWCVETEQLDSNPCTQTIRKTKVAKAQGYAKLLSTEEIAKLLSPERPSGATRKTWARSRAIMALLLTTGMRNSELRALRPCDIDESHNQIFVAHGKGGKSRYLPYTEQAKAAVTDYLNSGARPSTLPPTALLFGHGKTAEEWHEIARSELSALVERHIKCAIGKQGVRTHALRHSNASFLLSSGVSIEMLQDLLGHANPQTTKNYSEFLTSAPTDTAAQVFATLTPSIA